MKIGNLHLALISLLLVLSSHLASARIFTSTDGRKISADFVSATEKEVTLKMVWTGKSYVIPLSRLTAADQAYIKEKREAADAVAAVESAKQKAIQIQASIVAYVQSQKGKKVGNGECWTLANAAFVQAKAERPGPRVWGRVVDWKTEPVLPGDIIEFETAHFKSGKRTGPNHTAVIMRKNSSGRVFVYQQNVGNTKIVVEGEFNLPELTKGKVIVYRYQPKSAAGQ